VTGGWRRLHNEELCNLYASPNFISVITLRKTSWKGHVAGIGQMRNAYNILVGKPEEKRILGRPRYRWNDNIRIDFREIVREIVGRIHLAQDRGNWLTLVNTVMYLRVP
jgi:hypothetical protein